MYAEEGSSSFLRVLHCPVMQHRQKPEKMPLADFFYMPQGTRPPWLLYESRELIDVRNGLTGE